jgi:hypothetical protein
MLVLALAQASSCSFPGLSFRGLMSLPPQRPFRFMRQHRDGVSADGGKIEVCSKGTDPPSHPLPSRAHKESNLAASLSLFDPPEQRLKGEQFLRK